MEPIEFSKFDAIFSLSTMSRRKFIRLPHLHFSQHAEVCILAVEIKRLVFYDQIRFLPQLD